jgi:hypothetical protein
MFKSAFGVCNSWFAQNADFSGLLTKVSWTCLRVLIDGLSHPVRFAAHRQPFCWDFLYHSQTVLSVGGSVCYLFQNLYYTITIDSVLVNSKTQNAFLSLVLAHVLSWLPPSSEICKFTMVSIIHTNLERFSTYWNANNSTYIYHLRHTLFIVNKQSVA